jgi:RNA polymerase sigma-B factor
MTQSCIADQLGISQMHVSRLLSNCCASVREQVLADAA